MQAHSSRRSKSQQAPRAVLSTSHDTAWVVFTVLWGRRAAKQHLCAASRQSAVGSRSFEAGAEAPPLPEPGPAGGAWSMSPFAFRRQKLACGGPGRISVRHIFNCVQLFRIA